MRYLHGCLGEIACFGVSQQTLENWEQGRRHPTGPARALLKIVDADPESALRTLLKLLEDLRGKLNFNSESP